MTRWMVGILFFAAILHAQAWRSVNLPETPLGITVAHGRMWVTGAHEMIAVSLDGGYTWRLVHRGGAAMLFTLSFATENIAYAAGSDNAWLSSTDGGMHWTEGKTNSAIREMRFLDTDLGIGVFDGWVLTTLDGGQHWRKRKQGRGWPLKLAVGQARAVVASDDGMVITSLDRGLTWHSDKLPGSNPSIEVAEFGGRLHAAVTAGELGKQVRSEYILAPGGNWELQAGPGNEYSDCIAGACLAQGGWVDVSTARPHYYQLPANGPLTHAWAVFSTMVCEVGVRLWCAASTAGSGTAKSWTGSAFQPPKVEAMPYFPPQAAAAIGRLEADGQLDQIQIVAVKQAAEVGPLLRAIQAMKFKPATLNGKPIAVTEMLNFK